MLGAFILSKKVRQMYYVNGLLTWNREKLSCRLVPNNHIRRHAEKMCKVSGKKKVKMHSSVNYRPRVIQSAGL